MDKKDLNNKAWFLIVWYGIARWILLSTSNPESQTWASNTLGNSMAIVIGVYLLAFVFMSTIQKSKLYFFVTIVLTLFNAWCLSGMCGIFIKDPSPVNFGYVMLDISILTFFNVMCIFCKHSIYNTNIEYNNYVEVVQ